MFAWLCSQVKRIVALSSGCLVFSEASLLASPDFNPQFRWHQEGITVAENHEKVATENNKNATKNNEGDTEKNNEGDENQQQEGATESGGVDKIIEALETSIQIDDIIEPPASYRYSSFNKRDPFSYPDREELVDDEFVVSKLQRYDVSSLKLVGVWRLSTGVAKALILTPTGEGVVAVMGDPVGQNNGEVMEIGRNKIIIREYLMTPDGTRQFNDIDMFLENYFGDSEQFTGDGLQSIPEQDGEVSLEDELNKLLKDANKLIKGTSTPAANVPSTATNAPKPPPDAPKLPPDAPDALAKPPHMPAATETIQAPASTNTPAQP